MRPVQIFKNAEQFPDNLCVPMKTLNLPRTDLTVSQLCLGTAEYGATQDETLSFQLLDAYVEGGGNFLDTALIYAAWLPAGKGSSESLIGKWLKSRQPQNLVLATKGGHMELNNPGKPRLSPRYLAWDVESSLKHLGVETIDLYYMHRDDTKRPVEDILATLEGMVADGKIRYYSFSNWSQKRAEAARMAAEEAGAHGFVCNQPLWSLAQTNMDKVDPTLIQMDEEFLSWHEKHGLAVVPYSSQAGGFFSKMGAGKELTDLPEGYQNELNVARFEAALAISAETGYSLSQIVLGYLLNQSVTVVPIIGCKSLSHLEDSLKATEVVLTQEQVESLRRPNSEN